MYRPIIGYRTDYRLFFPENIGIVNANYFFDIAQPDVLQYYYAKMRQIKGPPFSLFLSRSKGIKVSQKESSQSSFAWSSWKDHLKKLSPRIPTKPYITPKNVKNTHLFHWDPISDPQQFFHHGLQAQRHQNGLRRGDGHPLELISHEIFEAQLEFATQNGPAALTQQRLFFTGKLFRVLARRGAILSHDSPTTHLRHLETTLFYLP